MSWPMGEMEEVQPINHRVEEHMKVASGFICIVLYACVYMYVFTYVFMYVCVSCLWFFF